MMNRNLRLLLSTLLLGVLVIGTSGIASGYTIQSRVRIIVSGPNVVRCDRAATINAKVVFRDNGKPVPGQVVRWALRNSRSSGDGLSATSTVTNGKGKAQVRLAFGPAVGAREVRVSATDASSTISVRCAGGLPETSIVPPQDWVEPAASVLLRPTQPVNLGSVDTVLPATGLRLERLGIDLPIVEGDGFSVPEGSVSHYPDTSWPGDGSNAYFYAHAREGNFLELWQVRTGDLLEIDLADGRIERYHVTRIVPVVAYDAFEYLEPTRSERVTLQTSLWYDDTAPRFVVIAEPAPGA